MLTGRQIRAARGLLNWDASDLAEKAKVTRDTIYRIESGAHKAQEATLVSIARILDLQGVELTEDEGVKIRKNQVRIFSGAEGYKQFLDHIYETMKDGGRICQFNLSDGKNLPHAGDYAQKHLERMGKIKNLDARVLTIEGDDNFPAKHCVYRWLSKENKILMPYYVYGDFVVMPIYKTEDHIEVISIQSKLLIEQYVNQFDLFWSTAIIPPKNKGGK